MSESCIIEDGYNGTISNVVGNYYGDEEKCWKIQVPENYSISLTIDSFESRLPCELTYIKVTMDDRLPPSKQCPRDFKLEPFTGTHNVTIFFLYSIRYQYREYMGSSFSLHYSVEHMQCKINESFRCSPHFCIPRHQVCDGTEQCENGSDEYNCKTGILAVKGIDEARRRGIVSLKNKRTASYGWKEYSYRAVVALHLAAGSNFSTDSLEEKLMAKQIELKTALALLRSPVSNSQLSMMIHALLVTCRNPRHFYGYDLVKRLQDQVSVTSNYMDPVSYLALCNAGEQWPTKATDDLVKIFNESSEYPFMTDISAVATLAVSCLLNQTSNQTIDTHLLDHYETTIGEFKSLQNADGSFGSLYTTALVTQALMAGGEEGNKDWDANATVHYLMKEMNQSSVDLLATYLSLPIFNAKTLSDIYKTNCSTIGSHDDDSTEAEEDEYQGPKIRVQYSLYVGDQRDVIHTMSLRVPIDSTAYQVMKIAAANDPKFKFQWRMMRGKMYVYEVNKIINDPEVGKFWFLYLGATNTSVLKHTTDSPKEITFNQDGHHLIMWYKHLINRTYDSEVDIIAAMNLIDLFK